MEVRQNRVHLPALRKLPFLQSVQHLHSHNTHVKKVCLANKCAQTEAYDTAKEHYKCESEAREEQRNKALQEAIATKRKSLESKRKEHQLRNRENLHKLQRALAEQRGKLAKKEQQHMLESQKIKQQYQHRQQHQHSLHTFHHSVDKLNRLKLRQEAQLGYSQILLQENQKRVQAANERKLEHLDESRTAIKNRKDGESNLALEKSREKEFFKNDEQLQRIIQKYSAANERIATIASLTEKSAQTKRTELQKALDKHRKMRTHIKEEQEKIKQADVKTDLNKIQRADQARKKSYQEKITQMEAKRQQKQRIFLTNSFYLQEEAERRANVVLKRHHESLIQLNHSKSQHEVLRCKNLYDSFRTALRS